MSGLTGPKIKQLERMLLKPMVSVYSEDGTHITLLAIEQINE